MKSVLVVDDEAHVRRVTKHFLEHSGYHVETACDGQEALEIVMSGDFDALVIDLLMPRMGGHELCQEIEARIPDRKFFILITTSSTEDEHREWAQDLPRSEFLEKPISLRKLLNRLDHHLGRGRPAEGGER